MPALLADFREYYHISALEIGTDSCYWGEAIELIRALAEDPRTRLSGKMCGVKYRTSVKDYVLAALVAGSLSNSKALEKISPFDGMAERAAQNSITEKEREAATIAFLRAHGIEYRR